MQVNNRILDDHRKFIRSLPCVRCGSGPSEFAHVRASVWGDVVVSETERGGSGLKPHDRWAVPLCRACHTLQHNRGEPWFWNECAEMNPLELASALYRNTGSRRACLGILLLAREGVTI